MTKYKKIFQDYFMQSQYENLRHDGCSMKQAKKEVVKRFKEYDENKPLSIFVK